jgi:uroporphyrinogen-III synthase
MDWYWSIDVTLFTAAVQIDHLIEVADEMNAREPLICALNETTIASIGPVTSEQLREYGIRTRFLTTRRQFMQNPVFVK